MDELEGFEDFWKVYPRHVGKIDAQKAYRQAIRLVSSATIVNAARQYAFECIGKEMQYVKLPAGWLRAGRWGDVLSRTVDKPEDTAPVSVPTKIFVADGTPEMDAWDAYLRRVRGLSAPRSKAANGWWFETQWPPVEEAVA
jgi:hypothetical protein